MRKVESDQSDRGKGMMRTIRVAYTDWWTGFEPAKYIYQEILSKYYNIEISDKPDYVFCSLYSHECLKYDAIRIFTTGDNYTPDFNLYDYAIAFDYLSFADRYIRVPNWIMNPKYKEDVELMLHKHENVKEEDYDRRGFCAWVCSNGKGNPIRESTFRKLSEYKLIASGGRYLNNIGQPNGVSNKIEFQKDYRFSFALQDSFKPGYLDEKLIQCFSARTIPIFWGDDTAYRFFNQKAFISAHDFNSQKEMIEEVIRIDNNKNEYLDRLSAPAMVDPDYIGKTYKLLEDFLINIIEQPLDKAKRRTMSTWSNYLKNIFEEANAVSNSKKSLWNRLFSH